MKNSIKIFLSLAMTLAGCSAQDSLEPRSRIHKSEPVRADEVGAPVKNKRDLNPNLNSNDSQKRSESEDREKLIALIKIWNEAATGIYMDGFSMVWDTDGIFPHPTYNGGSPEAYQVVSDIMIEVLEPEQRYQKMKDNGLLELQVHQSGSGNRSLRELATQFSDHDYLPGFIDGASRDRLNFLIMR